MIDKNYSNLKLLPIDIQLFGEIYTTHSSTVPGTYAQGSFPTNRFVRITLHCNGDDCNGDDEQEYVYYFNGISSSSTTFTPVNSSYAFNSPIVYNMSLSGENGAYPFTYTYSLSTTQTNLINALAPGTYYVWYNSEYMGTLTITSAQFAATFTTRRNFVVANKLGNNPIISQLTWNNPTASNLYYYAALSTSQAPSSGTVHGFYGPYSMPAGGNGSINTYIQYANVGTLTDNSNLYLISYKTTSATWNLLQSGFNTTSQAAIFKNTAMKVRNIYFYFENPSMSPRSAKWAGSVIMPIYQGFNRINWSNTSRLGQTYYISERTYNIANQYNLFTTINGITNNTYWFNMSGSVNIKNTYYINYKSALPSNAGLNWINGSTTFQVNPTSYQTFTIPFPDSHGIAANENGEYIFNGYDITLTNGSGNYSNVSNGILNISPSTYGNININAKWGYQKYAISGTISAINSGTLMDITGATKSFGGYNYNFYNGPSSTNPASSISYTSNASNGPLMVRLEAESRPGYEFLSSSVITYPFGADGSIASVPYDVFHYLRTNSFNSVLPAPLWGNSGNVNLYYEIDPKMAGDIQVGMEMRPFNHPIYVSLNSNITAFTYNGEIYNSTWPNTYVYNTKTYYKLNGATFNVLGSSFVYNLTDLVTTAGFYAPNKQISIVGTSITTNEQILNNAFVNLPDATPITYNITTLVGTGVVSASITHNNYNVLTDTFKPNILSITKAFGYNTISIYGNIYNAGLLIQDNLTAFAQVIKPSYNDYNYVLTAVEETYYISKYKINNVEATPYGISSYTLSKTNYVISTSKQEVTVSYTMNNGFQMNTSNSVNIGNFYNSTLVEFYGADQTYNKFNIPASTIGNVIFKAPEPKKIQYFINVASLTGINGISSVVMTPNNYYISNSATKQTISASISVNNGYSLPTGNLIVSGSSTSNINKSSFNINTNGYGDITVKPASAIINTYNVLVNAINIPGRTFSGISNFTVSPSTFNVESLTFKPSITAINYTNEGFSGFNASFTDTGEFADSGTAVNNLFDITQGTYRDRLFNIYAIPVTFNIGVTKDASISTYNWTGNIYNTNTTLRTYNVLSSDIPMIIDNIVVTNQLYLPKANFTIGTVTAGSTGNKSFALSSALKTNNITINALPIGYASSVANVGTYTATNGVTKTVLLTHTMNAGYAQPTGNLVVSNVTSAAGASVAVTNINNRSFVIPKDSWGDITVAVANPIIINYIVNFQNGNALTPSLNVPVGVNPTGFGISPVNYWVTDTYPKVFTVSATNLPGYQTPTWSISGGSNKSGNTFNMSIFNTTVPVVTVTGGNIITYNMNIVKGTGINNYKYGVNTNLYTASATLDNYTVLDSKTVSLNSIGVINSLWNSVANYNAIVVTAGNTGDKTNTVSTTLKTSNINKGTLPTGIGAMAFNMNTYQSVINTQVRTVGVSYTMSNGYSLPSTMTVTGSLDGAGSPVTITPPNANQFNIAPNTWNTLIVTPSAPAKTDYDITSGTLPYGMASMAYSIESTIPVNKYQISTTARTVTITYTMNNGFAQPTGNPTISLNPEGIGLLGTVINNVAFSIPINGWGNIIVTPNAISKIQYFINVGTKPSGINTVTFTPNNYYYIDNANIQSVSISYTANLGWSIPTANPTVVGSNTTIVRYNAFNILTNGYGNITVTSANPITNVYNVILGANPKAAAINTWSVSPTNYRVTDNFNTLNNTKLFTINATPKIGYQNPTWSINGNANSANWFLMPVFTETAPNLQITAGSPIEYYMSLNYNTTNSGITAGTISYNNGTASINNFNIETPTFLPVISGITYANGYNNGYVVTPAIGNINVGSYGNKSYVIMGTPMTYSISNTLGTGINTAVLNRTSYNIQQTPFNVSWASITYNPGYSGYTLSGDTLSVPTGAFGNRSYTITANIVTYNVSINDIAIRNIVSFNYGGALYNNSSNKIIDTYNVVSANKSIILTDVVYDPGHVGSPIIDFGKIYTGSTGNKEYSFNSVRNVYIDVSLPTSEYQKVNTFNYNGNSYSAGTQDTVWVDYFVPTKSTLTMNVSSITYKPGYTGSSSYNFGTISPATLAPYEDKTYVMNNTSLIPYNISVTLGSHVTGFTYGATPYNTNSIINTYNVETDDVPVSITGITYSPYYEGVSSALLGTVALGSTGDKSFPITAGTPILYDITINLGAHVTGFTYGSTAYTGNSIIDTYDVEDANKVISVTGITYAIGYQGSSTETLGTILAGSNGDVSYTITAGTPISYNITINLGAHVTGFTYGSTAYTGNSIVDTYNIESANKTISVSSITYASGYAGNTSATLGTITSGSIGNKSYTITAGATITYYVNISLGSHVTSFTYNSVSHTATQQIGSFTIESAIQTYELTNITYEDGYAGDSTRTITVNTGTFNDVNYTIYDAGTTQYTVTVNLGTHVASFTYNSVSYTATQQIGTFTVEDVTKTYNLTGITYDSGYQGITSHTIEVVSGTSNHIVYNIPAGTTIPYNITINLGAHVTGFTYGGTAYTSNSVVDTYNIESPNKTISISSITYASGYQGDTYETLDTILSGSTGHETYTITAGTTITYYVNVNLGVHVTGFTYNSIAYTANQRIGSFTIESTTQTYNLTSITYDSGYQGITSHTITVNSGSYSTVNYTIPNATTIAYNITINLGAHVTGFTYGATTYTSNSVVDTYNIETPNKTISVSSITYASGYEGDTSATLDTILLGSIGHETYTITAGTPIVYTITINLGNHASGFNYGPISYTESSQVDTYTIESANKIISVTNVTYLDDYVGTTSVTFGTITTGSIGNKVYSLGDVRNVYIDVNSWTSADLLAKHYKISSFIYNGVTYNVNSRDIVWIDYFIPTKSVLTITLNNVIYQSGYTGPTSYTFGIINPATLVPYEDKTYTMNLTTLVPYKVYIKKDHTITSFRYRTGFTETGSLLTVNTNDLIEVGFTVQSKLDITVYDIDYVEGYHGYNNGDTPNPTTINYDYTNYDRTSNIGSSAVPTLVTYDKLTNYTITITNVNPKLKSFDSRIQYNGGSIQVLNSLYTILSDPIDVSAIDLVYQTADNADGTWTLYTGPNVYGYEDGVNTHWSISTGSTGNKVFSIPVDDIAIPAVFTISYVGQSVTANGYTSAITPLKTSYIYKSGTSIAKNNTSSFTVVDNAVLPAISTRLAANDPIHYSYTLSSDSAGMTVTNDLVTISNTDFGNKVIDINWTEVIFSVTIKDHYIIRDVYGIQPDVTKTSPVSGLKTDADVFTFNYSLHNTDQNYLVNNSKDIRRTGWTFVNAKETTANGTIEITGTASYLTGFTIPAGWYDSRVMRLIYTPNTYTITLDGADPLTVIYDHEIQKWGPNNVPSSVDKIFNGYEDINDDEKISYSGIYNFSVDSYSTDVTFTPRWIDRNYFNSQDADFVSYDATSNVVINSTQMEEVTISSVSYSRFKESTIGPTLVQNIIPESAIESNQDSLNTKYMFKLTSGYIKLRKLNNYSIVKGYKTLTFIDSDLNTYLNTPANLTSNMIIDMNSLINLIDIGWSGANATDLTNIGINKSGDLWSYTSTKLATADIFRIMLKVSSSPTGPFTYWIFDGIVETSNLGNTKQNLTTKQDMFLFSTSEGLKEVMKIRDKNNNIIYDRTHYVLDNNSIVTNWEDTIIGQTKPVDVYGLLPINKDKVYTMNMNIKASTKSWSLAWSGFISSKLPYSSNIRVGEKVGITDVINYSRVPIKDIYANWINNTSALTLNILKNYSVVDNKLYISNLDSILGAGATEKGALSSNGAFYIPTFYYELSIDNANSSTLRTATLSPLAKRYVYTPIDRNIGSYVIQGPASDVDNSLRFLLSDLTGVVAVHIGILDSNLNSITSLIPLTQETTTSWFKLSAPSGSLAPNSYYTIVIETADKLMYNNLLIYKRFNDL